MDRLEIMARAWTAGANVEGLDKPEAIRAIQRAEGFEACFGSGRWEVCGQSGCAFREDCRLIPLVEDPCHLVTCDASGDSPSE